MLVVDVVTIFPEVFANFLEWSMIKKAQKTGAIKIRVHNLRRWGIDKRGTVDDRPYGGGPGMILRPEPIYHAIEELRKTQVKSEKNSKKLKVKSEKLKVILLSPKGQVFTQKIARQLAKLDHLILICGHYEGVDERVAKYMVDEELSIGQYVLSGGELPAMVVIDAVARLLPGVLEKQGAAEVESFSPVLKKMVKKLLPHSVLAKLDSLELIEFPQYTRPEIFKGWRVPKVLLSGNHQKIAEWRARHIKRLLSSLKAKEG